MAADPTINCRVSTLRLRVVLAIVRLVGAVFRRRPAEVSARLDVLPSRRRGDVHVRAVPIIRWSHS